MESRPVVKSLRAFALSAVRWLYWRTRAYEGDPLYLKALEGVWWHVRGDSLLRHRAANARPEDRV